MKSGAEKQSQKKVESEESRVSRKNSLENHMDIFFDHTLLTIIFNHYVFFPNTATKPIYRVFCPYVFCSKRIVGDLSGVGSSSGPGPRARAGMGPVVGARGSPRGPVEPRARGARGFVVWSSIVCSSTV